MESLYAQENEELQIILQEYNEFGLCRELGKFPSELEQQPATLIQRWVMYIQAEGQARKWMMDHPKR